MTDKPTAPTVHPLDTVHMLLEIIAKNAPQLETSVTNPDGSLNNAAGTGTAPIASTSAAAPVQVPAQSASPAPKGKENLQASAGNQSLTDAILNIGQIMPVAKAQLPQGKGLSELLGGKSTTGADVHSNGAAVIKTVSSLLKLLG